MDGSQLSPWAIDVIAIIKSLSGFLTVSAGAFAACIGAFLNGKLNESLAKREREIQRRRGLIEKLSLTLVEETHRLERIKSYITHFKKAKFQLTVGSTSVQQFC